ncbi:hypothetical protein [Bradyrhizobium sp. ORS 285]|uniref:hypothetical protein n=1 Tax=Bradyrhizobium sp. ORS 285 TaxID=115808 RepID=UPI0002FF1158|nr:hypothetical protein [Bradyrhizobium sp. ORS 285]
MKVGVAMAGQPLDSSFLTIVGHSLSSVAGAIVAWLAGGSAQMTAALTAGLALAAGMCTFIFSVLYHRTFGVLSSGGARKGSAARAAYDALRESLAGTNIATRIYNSLLSAFLNGVERFLGDVGMANRSLFPRAFGLATPAPLWTVPAFDRCLWLALIYPFATIVLIWMISGHAGPAETALGLKASHSAWERAVAIPLGAVTAFAVWLSHRAKNKTNILAWIALILAIATIFASVGSNIIVVYGVCAIAIAIATTGSLSFRYAGALAVAFTVFFAAIFVVVVSGAFSIASAAASPYYGSSPAIVIIALSFIVIAVAVTIASAFAFAFVIIYPIGWAVSVLAEANDRQGIFLSALTAGMIACCIASPALFASKGSSDSSGPLLLFLGLLTLINAPFDWASLGLTRALLHRGLERGGWWPYFFALIDAVLATIIITLLALAMVLSVQAFDTVRVHNGGQRVLPLQPIFDGIANHPAEPEYWWLYVLLLSSMIPSFVNLMFGGVAFLRGIPGVRWLLLRFLPKGQAVAPFDRAWISLVLTVQTFLGAFLGLAAQVLLAVGIVGYAMPWLGFHILEAARSVANLDLPERVWTLVFG